MRSAVPEEVLLLINVGVDPLKHHRDLNILMTTERTDSLSYAGVRDNLVLTLDQVTLNSWNEVMVSRYDGPHALLDCLRDYLNQLPSDHLPRLRAGAGGAGVQAAQAATRLRRCRSRVPGGLAACRPHGLGSRLVAQLV